MHPSFGACFDYIMPQELNAVESGMGYEVNIKFNYFLLYAGG